MPHQLTNGDIRRAQSMRMAQFRTRNGISAQEMRFVLICETAEVMRSRSGRLPTMEEAIADRQLDDCVIVVRGTVADALAASEGWTSGDKRLLEILPVIDQLENGCCICLVLCGLYEHVVKGTLYAWRVVSSDESDKPGALLSFETVREAMKRTPGIEELVSLARTQRSHEFRGKENDASPEN